MVFLGNMTENEEISPKEVKNSQKKIGIFLIFDFFFFLNLFVTNLFQT